MESDSNETLKRFLGVNIKLLTIEFVGEKGYLLKRGTTRNDLQRPTTSIKRPETTHNEQETT